MKQHLQFIAQMLMMQIDINPRLEYEKFRRVRLYVNH